MKIDITTTNRLFTLRRNPPRTIFMTDRAVTRRQRLKRKLNEFPLKPTHRKHHVSAGGGPGREPYRMKQTHEVNWLGFDFLVTTRYPLTAEQRSQWASSSHLADSTALRHY